MIVINSCTNAVSAYKIYCLWLIFQNYMPVRAVEGDVFNLSPREMCLCCFVWVFWRYIISAAYQGVLLFPHFLWFFFTKTQWKPFLFPLLSAGISPSLKESNCDLGLYSLLESSLCSAEVPGNFLTNQNHQIRSTQNSWGVHDEWIDFNTKRKGSITNVAHTGSLFRHAAEVTAEPQCLTNLARREGPQLSCLWELGIRDRIAKTSWK